MFLGLIYRHSSLLMYVPLMIDNAGHDFEKCEAAYCFIALLCVCLLSFIMN